MGNKMLEEFYEHLDRLDKTRKKYAIWGAGVMGKSALSYINQHNSKLKHEFLVDNNPALWGKNDVISPKDFFDGKMSDIDTVFICVYVADEVEKQLRGNGYSGKTMAVVVSVFSQEYYKGWYKDNQDNIDKLKTILADERSIKTLDCFYNVAKTGDVSFWSEVNGDSINKTLENDILHFEPNENVIDIGAFIGDTVERFLEITGGKYNKIVCFEPEPNNYLILKDYLKDKSNTSALQIAVSDSDGNVGFWGNMSEGGVISENGNIAVEMKRLDSLTETSDATFIKISTLGHELEALRGAKDIIKKNRPKLSYYCGGHQMWEIPLFLTALVPEYKFYIRHYGVGMQAMMGYAICDD